MPTSDLYAAKGTPVNAQARGSFNVTPTPDNKYYYAKLVGVNAQGTSEFYTNNPFLHD